MPSKHSTFIASSFAGCECIGQIKAQYQDGVIEIYELSGSEARKHVGAWYPDMSMMIWPIDWYWKWEEEEKVDPPPAVPRNRTHRFVTVHDDPAYPGKQVMEIHRLPMRGLPPPDDGVKRKGLQKKQARKPLRKKLRRR